MYVVILLVCSFLAALISGAAGFGGSLLLLPVVTACVDAERAVPVLTLAQLIGNIARMASGWRQIDWKSVGLFSLTALPLAALGAFGFSVLPKDAVTRVLGGALTGGLSGLCGSGGPIGAAVFLSLGLSPVAYIASEAATATSMHLLKTVIYSKLASFDLNSLLLGLAMGAVMVGGTFAAKRFIKNMEKNRFQKYVAVLLMIVGTYMLIFGA